MTTMQLWADLAQLRTIREFVAEACRDLCVDARSIPDLQLAVDEICSNSIRHAYGGQEGQLQVTVQAVAEGVQLTVRDWGAAFDPEMVSVPDVDAPLEQRSLGGLGLFLVRQLVDELRFEFDEERGNSVTMVKRLPRKGGEG
jgi:serine/threonine-protein kinase RsbW